MSYLDRIRACTGHNLAGFLPFHVDGAQVGWVRPKTAAHLRRMDGAFDVTDRAVSLSDRLTGFEDRSAAMAEAAVSLAEAGIVRHLRGEDYSARRRWGEPPLFRIERGATTVFGFLSFGIHLNGFARTGGGLEMWVARRAGDRLIAPGKLDNLVGGGQPHGLTLTENVVKECGEEAGLSPEMALRAKPVGAITYALEKPNGLKRDVLFLYDLELPEDFQPVNMDGEVSEFHRWPVARAAETVRDTDEFKFNCAPVVIDFLIRHGILTPDEPDYLEILTELRS